MRTVRAGLAHLTWWVCVLVATAYAAAVCLVGLDAPAERTWVEAVYRLADAAGGDVFARGGWVSDRADVSTPFWVALASWGAASAAWLAGGWLVSGVLRPRRRSSGA